MKMKKAFAAILAGTMCAGMLVGCGTSQATQSDSKTDRAVKVSDYDGEITLVIATKDEFLGTLDNAVKAAAEINNVELHSVDCGADQDKQNDAVRAAAENGVDALIVNLADDSRAQDVIDAAGDLPIVFVNRCPKDTSLLNDTHVYVGSDESTSGVMQGELLAGCAEKGWTNRSTLLYAEGHGRIAAHNGTVRKMSLRHCRKTALLPKKPFRRLTVISRAA